MPQFSPEELLRRKRQFYPVAAGVMALLGWGLYISAAFLGKDWINSGTKPNTFTVYLYLLIALVLTIGGGVMTFRTIRRVGLLLNRGMRTEATILKVGSVSSGLMRPVTLAYQVQGHQYTIRKDMPEVDVSNFTPATRISVIYDPQNPEQCELINPSRPQQPVRNTMSENIREILHKPMLVVLYVVNAAVMIGTMRLLGGESEIWMVPILVMSIPLVYLEDELLGRLLHIYQDNPFASRMRWALPAAFAAGAIGLAVFNGWSHQRDIERQRRIDEGRKQLDQQVQQLKQRATGMPR